MSLWHECLFNMSVNYINIHTHQYHSISPAIEMINVVAGKDEVPSNQKLFSVGIHPWYIEQPDLQWKLFTAYLEQPGCIAIGECGIDKICNTPLILQQEYFEKQCERAVLTQKPVVIHAVKSHFDCLAILNRFQLKKVIFHGFNNRYTILEQLLHSNCYISFGDALLNTKSQAAALIKFVPLNRLFLETDNSSTEIEVIYEKAAQLMDCSLDELKKSIYSNYKTVFNN